MPNVKITSKEGRTFLVNEEYANLSPTLWRMRAHYPGEPDGEEFEFALSDYTAHILQICIRYLKYKKMFTDHIDILPRFQVNEEDAMELLRAANFLCI